MYVNSLIKFPDWQYYLSTVDDQRLMLVDISNETIR